jgi:hypothetical protein
VFFSSFVSTEAFSGKSAGFIIAENNKRRKPGTYFQGIYSPAVT